MPVDTARPTGGTAPAATGTPSAPSATHGAGSPTTGSPAAACVAQVLGNLTLAQRVGELFIVGVDGNIAGPELTAAERTYHFGSLLLNKSAAGTAALAAQTAAMQELAPADTSGVRLFIAANQEGGQIQQLTGPGFATMPSALEQGSWSLSTLRAAATDWGTDLRAGGVNLDLAPVMDVVPRGSASSNAPIGQLDREFGFDPVTNGEHGTAFIQGMAAAGVTSVAKHFPGLGRVAGNTDFTSNVVDNVTTTNDPYLNSFRAAVNAGVPMVMVALATYTKIDPTQLAAFSPTVMRLLRNGLGFGGVIVSDDLGQAAAVQAIPVGSRATGFLTAGGDLITSQSLAPAEQMAAAVLAKASGSAAFRATVDAAAQRVLAAKQAAGLLPC
ncbi:MAG TPA: glycoside hydrolase family 3 N-terminal domain-containing protein [Trebonia sp.]|nr:glycoside hydrolase family 3 N-terminal domain-containing protein [Trebonia sp.]